MEAPVAGRRQATGAALATAHCKKVQCDRECIAGKRGASARTDPGEAWHLGQDRGRKGSGKLRPSREEEAASGQAEVTSSCVSVHGLSTEWEDPSSGTRSTEESGLARQRRKFSRALKIGTVSMEASGLRPSLWMKYWKLWRLWKPLQHPSPACRYGVFRLMRIEERGEVIR